MSGGRGSVVVVLLCCGLALRLSPSLSLRPFSNKVDDLTSSEPKGVLHCALSCLFTSRVLSCLFTSLASRQLLLPVRELRCLFYLRQKRSKSNQLVSCLLAHLLTYVSPNHTQLHEVSSNSGRPCSCCWVLPLIPNTKVNFQRAAGCTRYIRKRAASHRAA